MREIFDNIKAGATRVGKILERLFTGELVLLASNTPEIVEAAHYWREQVAQACVVSTGARRHHLQVEVKEALTEAELDDFERALAIEFARTKIYDHKSRIFSASGQEVAAHLTMASIAAQVNHKMSYWGYMTRMRIRPEQVDREVGDIFDYGKGNWQPVWQKN